MTTRRSWTHEEVKAELIEALRWVKRYGGAVGPTGVRSCMPAFAPSLDDHLEEGWGLPEVAADDEVADRTLAVPPPPERVEEFMDALSWVSRYLAGDHPDLARVLSLWLRCKVDRSDFGNHIAGRMSRSSAYRLRDRGLTVIAIRLSGQGGRS